MVYNLKQKEKFLEDFENENTKDVYLSIFKNSQFMEEKLGKDLYNFSDEELEYFIANYIKPQTKQSARTYCTVLTSYIQFAIDKKFTKNQFNPLKRKQDYFYQFVKDQNDLYLSKGEIDAILFPLVNNQDKFPIIGLFNGIQGIQLSELTSLTIQQVLDAIHNDNKLTVVNKKGQQRVVEVDKQFLDIALLAYKDDEYYKKNGLVDYSPNVKDVVKLPIDTNYILKPTVTSGNRTTGQISHHTVYNRLEMIKELEGFEEYHYALTSKNIARSGMIYEAKKMMDRGEKLTKLNLEKICEKFGIKYKWSLKDFLNEETVNDVYEYKKVEVV